MKFTLWKLAALLPLALCLGAGCPLIPDIQEKIVELAVGGSTTAVFEAQGLINTIDETKTIDFADSLDIEQILDDAGVDVDSVISVNLAGVSYRVKRPDPTATRRIEDATITISRGGGAATPLVTSFSEDVNSVTSFKTAPLDAAGVTLINDLLADILDNLQNGTPIGPTDLTYGLVGNSVPGGVDTDFAWELKVDITIVGTVKVEVPS